jgi:HEAT repeat protein
MPSKPLPRPTPIPSHVQTEIKTLSATNAYSVSRALAAGRLRRYGQDATAAIPQLIDTLNDTNPLEESWTVSEGHLKSRKTAAAEEAVARLAKIGTPAVEPLIAALSDNRVNVRVNAATALGRISDLRTIEPLIKALEDDSWFVRQKAAWALGELKDKRATDPLIVCLREARPRRTRLSQRDWLIT